MKKISVSTILSKAKKIFDNAIRVLFGFNVKHNDIEIIPFVQPVFDGDTRELVGMQIDMKLIDSRNIHHCAKRHLGEILHQKGIDAVDDMVTELIKKSSCEFPKLLKDYSNSLFISFSIDALQLYSHRVFDEIVHLRNILPSHCLVVVEISECTLPEYDDELVDIIEKLRAKGVHFSLVNFGKCSSSLLYLEHAGFSSLKLDQTMTLAYKDRLVNKSLVNSIVSVTKELGIDVEAEGIESEEQCQLLTKCGVRKMQGRLFSKPVPLSHFSLDSVV